MLNLLFISDNPKAEYMKNVLQPLLKVIIDVVTDFDHGLKDVFEKRPTTVCIQDQIGGVTGDSVARHIQMLLGNSAPTFILLHSGNGKAKAIKGLYEHLVDMSQPNEIIAVDIKNTLKSLLGEQWDKIYIPPKLSPTSIRSSVAVPAESREDADKLVDDFLSDLETSGFTIADEQPPPLKEPAEIITSPASAETVAHIVSESEIDLSSYERVRPSSDEMAELLLAQANKAQKVSNPVVAPPGIDTAVAEPIYFELAKPTTEVKHHTPAVKPASSPKKTSGISLSEKSIAATTGKDGKTGKAASAPGAQPSHTANFQINKDSSATEEHIPEDLLLAFEENYRSNVPYSKMVIIVVVCLACVVAAGSWYVVKQKPQMVHTLKNRIGSLFASKQSPPVIQAPETVKKPVSPPIQKLETPPVLPAFIPKEGLDNKYSSKHPGWERYVGKHAEFRLFKTSGHIRAVQVLAINNVPVPETLVTSVLQELVGSQEYQIVTRSTKAGIQVESCEVQNKGALMIYRKNSVVRAFVVSID